MLIVMGSCIGSGIFITPAGVAAEIPNTALLLGTWVLGGFIALSGALTYGELAGRFPAAGGVYAYLKEAYGPLAAFFFGWVVLMAVTSGAIAGLALGFSKFLAMIFPMDEIWQKAVAVVVIVACTAVNVGGLGIAKHTTGLVTTLKVLGIFGLIVAGLVLWQTPIDLDWTLPDWEGGWTSKILLGLVGVYWSYGGWHHLTYLSAEFPEARKKLSLAMVVGVLGVMAAYVLANLAYLRVLSLETMASSGGVAASMMEQVVPNVGGKALAALVCVSMLGSILIFTMSAPRIYAAMAADGVFFPALAKLHPRYGTPALAIISQSAWAVVLIFLWGTFNNLVDYVTYSEAVFLIMAAASVYIFRFKKSGNSDGFKVPGYPFTPLLYIILSTLFVLNGLLAKPMLMLSSSVLFILGLVLFVIFRKQKVT